VITAVGGLLIGLAAVGTAVEKLGRLVLDWRRRNREGPPDDTPTLAA
jgi:hypothetical protein